MEYHRLKPRFNTAAYDPKRISFVYVLSQNEGKGPYKVGMSKGDLWRRMSNYATAFVDFYVYYLVPVPYADVFAVERFMHRALPGRKAFPSETKERGNLSEWFDCSQRDLRRAFRDLAKDPKLNPIGAFRVTKSKIYRMTALEQDKGGQLVTRLELSLLRLTLLTLALQVRSTLLPTALQCLPPGLAEVVRLLGVGLRHWGCRRRPFAVGWLSGGAEVDAEVGLGLAGHRQSSVYPCLRK